MLYYDIDVVIGGFKSQTAGLKSLQECNQTCGRDEVVETRSVTCQAGQPMVGGTAGIHFKSEHSES